MKNRKNPIIIFISVLCLLFLAILLMQIILMNILPFQLALPLLGIFVLFTLIIVLWYNFTARRPISRVFTALLILILTGTYGLGNYYLYRTSRLLTEVTNLTDEVTHSVSIVTMKQNPFDSLESLNGNKIGITPELDEEGTKRSMDDINQKIEYEAIEYSNYADELADLYEGSIAAIILNDANRSMIYDIEIYGHFSTQTKVLHETKWKTKRTTEVFAADPVNVTSEPFTVLITGNDSYGGLNENSRSDSNMLVTVNPNTHQVLMTSVPRDTYVEMACSADAQDCPDGEKDKLTHSGLYGVGTTEQSLEQYFGTKINYYVRVNFSSLVNLVDALGGIDIEVGKGLAVESFRANDELEGVHEGMNHLDGERALAYSRERYAYEDGDAQRVKNQQQVLRAIIQKMISPTMITNYGKFVDALSGSFETNMASDDLMSLIRYQLMLNPEWKFSSYGLSGSGDTQFCPTLGDAASVMILDEGSYETAINKINAVKDGKDPDKVEDLATYSDIEQEVEEEAEQEEIDTLQQSQDYSEYSTTEQYQTYSPSQPQEEIYYDPNTYVDSNYGY